MDAEKMVLIWQILFLTLVFGAKADEEYRITVTLSGRIPLVILNPIGVPKGLDVLIIENFAKKLNFVVIYSHVNRSQNFISTDCDYLDGFPDQLSMR